FALLGGSGSGKSTLLRILAGLEKPDQGRILIDGLDVTRLPPYQRPVNMMFQSYALFPHMTVAQNIAFGLRQDRMPAAQIRERVGEMLELVRMPQLGNRKPHQLSGGQCQFELMSVQEQLGTTFIMVTHDQEEAMAMSSRIAVMDTGRIVQVSTPAVLYEYPATRFVAEFIGGINLFEGRVTAMDEDT